MKDLLIWEIPISDGTTFSNSIAVCEDESESRQLMRQVGTLIGEALGEEVEEDATAESPYKEGDIVRGITSNYKLQKVSVEKWKK